MKVDNELTDNWMEEVTLEWKMYGLVRDNWNWYELLLIVCKIHSEDWNVISFGIRIEVEIPFIDGLDGEMFASYINDEVMQIKIEQIANTNGAMRNVKTV